MIRRHFLYMLFVPVFFAIDSAEKRRAAAALKSPGRTLKQPALLADGTIDTDDRRALGGGYAFTSPASGDSIGAPPLLRRRRRN